MDRYKHWPEAFPLPDITAEMVLRYLLSSWLSRFSGLQTIMTDQGSKFESQLCEGVWYSPLRYEPHHPATNSFIDPLPPMLKAAIMCYEDEQWTKALTLVLLSIYITYKKDLQASIVEVIYGESLQVSCELLAAAASKVEPTVFI